MGQDAEFTLYTANCCGNEFNTSYPNKTLITCTDDLKRAAAVDHVAALYKTGYAKKDIQKKNPVPFHRANCDFIETDCLILDCDNTDTDEPDKWIWPEQIKADFPGVTHYIVTSRNHLKEKDGKSPRPKFHIYFPIEQINSVDEYYAFKNAMITNYPYFDFNAKDGARYFFGNPDAVVTLVDGGEA
jgi:hypothetical protein